MLTNDPNLETPSDTTDFQNDKANEEIIEDLLEEQSTHQEIIETVISSLDVDNSAMVNQSSDGHLWKFKYGSVEVFVQITGESDEDLLTVWASVLTFPINNEVGLMRKLLEMNWLGTFETCFGIFNNSVVVLCQRSVAELSPSEISRAITLVANIADENDDLLKAEFGGK
jgi:hypothetical protein